jgi:hypothetical protein
VSNVNISTLYFNASAKANARLQQDSAVKTPLPADTRTRSTDPMSSLQANPLDLAYQAAIDQINQAVEPFLGEGAIQRGLDAGVDVTPAATAERIVSLSTALYPAYQRQHPKQDPAEAAAKFVEIISAGVTKGFAEANTILRGLGVLDMAVSAEVDGPSDKPAPAPPTIGSNIDSTMALVMQGLQSFLEQFTAPQPR